MEPMLTRLSILALLVACTGPGSGPTQPLGLLATPTCVDPVAHGATPDDGQDDRAALQAAVDAACARPAGERHVCLPRGKFHAVRNPRIGATNLASIQIRCDDIELSGEGTYASSISMLGSGLDARDRRGPNDWWLVDAQFAARLHIHDLALLGDERRDNNEQTHLLQLVGPLESPVIERFRTWLPNHEQPEGSVQCATAPPGVECEMPSHGGGSMPCHEYVDEAGVRKYGLIGGACSVSEGLDGTQRWTLLGWYSGGDCIRLMGTWDAQGQPSQLIRDTRIRAWEAPECDRSALGLQWGHVGTRVEDSRLVALRDQVVDSEPTGHQGYKDLELLGVYMSRGSEQGGLTLSISGSSEGTSSALVDCKGGLIADGGTRLFDTDIVTIKDCHIDSGVVSDETLTIMKRAKLVRIIGGSIRRPVGAPNGPVIHITHQSGAAPTEVVLENVIVQQETKGPIIKIQAVRSFSMTGGKLIYRGPPWIGAGTVLVQAEAIGSDIDSVALAGVQVDALPGAVDGLVSMGRIPTRQLGGLSLIDIHVAPGALRRYVTSFFGGVGPALHATRVYAPGLASIAGGGDPVLCGGGCP
jgi:hypothetical protein